MSRRMTTSRKISMTALAWFVGLVIFFPILWTFLTSFKTELQAISTPAVFVGCEWTLENYRTIQTQSNYLHYMMNSIYLSLGSTALGLIFAIPAAWAMAFSPTKRTKDILLWMLSTKMLPAVGVLIPIYLLFVRFGLLDSRLGLIVVLFLRGI